jgi:N-acetylglucosaminyldiphosphoundecaprenol N-acetyl-beta-D-mannosaminyltransferase
MRKYQSVLGARIDAISWDEAVERIYAWSERREYRYVCICNVHSVVTAAHDPQFRLVINEADLATPDGAPIAWSLRHFGFREQQRINGPDLMWRYLRKAEQNGQSVYFYGSTEHVLRKLRESMAIHFPHLQIAGTYAPPFYAPTIQEDQDEVDAINHSGAHIVFVGLGCPKQEKWMAEHCGRINAVLVGVGAAFDYHSGMIKRAPSWFQDHGLEWLHRLYSEPRRLFKRYLVTNSLFIYGITRQLFSNRLNSVLLLLRKKAASHHPVDFSRSG